LLDDEAGRIPNATVWFALRDDPKVGQAAIANNDAVAKVIHARPVHGAEPMGTPESDLLGRHRLR